MSCICFGCMTWQDLQLITATRGEDTRLAFLNVAPAYFEGEAWVDNVKDKQKQSRSKALPSLSSSHERSHKTRGTSTTTGSSGQEKSLWKTFNSISIASWVEQICEWSATWYTRCWSDKSVCEGAKFSSPRWWYLQRRVSVRTQRNIILFIRVQRARLCREGATTYSLRGRQRSCRVILDLHPDNQWWPSMFQLNKVGCMIAVRLCWQSVPRQEWACVNNAYH